MRKIPQSNSSSKKVERRVSGNAIPSKSSHGYRPNGDRSSTCSIPPSGGSSIQNKDK